MSKRRRDSDTSSQSENVSLHAADESIDDDNPIVRYILPHLGRTLQNVLEEHDRDVRRIRTEHSEELKAVRRQLDAATCACAAAKAETDKLHKEHDRLKEEKRMMAVVHNEQMAKCDKKIAEQKTEINERRDQLRNMNTLRTVNAKLKEDIDKERQATRAEKDKCDQLRAQLDTVTKQFDEYKANVTAHAAAAEEVKQLQKLCDVKQGEYNNAMGVLSEQQAEITELKEEVQRLKCANKSGDHHRMSGPLAPTVAQVAANGEHIATVKRQLEAEHNMAKRVLEAQCDTAKRQMEAQHKIQLSAHEATERHLRNALSESQQKASELLAEKEAACSRRDEATVRLESLQRSLDELNEQRHRYEAAQKKHKAVALLLRKKEHALDEMAAKLKAKEDGQSAAASTSDKATTALVGGDATATSAGDNEMKKKAKEALRLCCDNYERLCGIAHLLDSDARAQIESVSGTMAKVRLGLGMSGCARSHSRITMDDVVLIAQLLHVAATAALTWAPAAHSTVQRQQEHSAAGSRAAALHAHLDTLRQTAAGNNADCSTCLAQRSVVAALVHKLRND